MGREVWAVCSDLHCGSTLGLCHPSGVQLDDGGRYMPSPPQLKLWECWETYWQSVKASLKAGDRLFILINGDAVDGAHHRSTQIVTENLPVTQQEIATAVLGPGLELDPAAVVIVRGTEAHVGSSASFEERLARSLDCVPDPVTGASSHWHFQAVSEGVMLDFAHHGRAGQRPWTRLTGVGTLATEIALAASDHGTRCPDLAIRSHYHTWIDSFDLRKVRVVQIAGWQLTTAFVHRIAAGSLPQIGGVIVTCEDGKYDLRKVKFEWKREEPWSFTESTSRKPKS